MFTSHYFAVLRSRSESFRTPTMEKQYNVKPFRIEPRNKCPNDIGYSPFYHLHIQHQFNPKNHHEAGQNTAWSQFFRFE